MPGPLLQRSATLSATALGAAGSAVVLGLQPTLDTPFGPLPAKLLPLTPAQYNSGTAGPIIVSARTALGQARDQIKAALASAKACRDALK